MRSSDINETSSRSHLLFMIRIKKRHTITHQLLESGKLTFIDLAGSERVAYIGLEEELYIEGLFINESLQCLAQIIKKLSEGRYVSDAYFQENILTHLLMDSIGIDGKTIMIVNISPAKFDMEATRRTLLFA